MDEEECIRCNNALAVDEFGYCGSCHWEIQAEVERGFYQISRYLRAWDKFRTWESAMPRLRTDSPP